MKPLVKVKRPRCKQCNCSNQKRKEYIQTLEDPKMKPIFIDPITQAIEEAHRIISKVDWPPKFKKCKHCNTTRSASAFSPMLASSDGLRQYCISCTRRLKKNPNDPKGNPNEPKPQPGINKRCTICKLVKPLWAFDAYKGSLDEHRAQCKVCLSKLK